MADPSPPATPEGQEPAAVEGQEPAEGAGTPPEGQEPEGKNYSQAYVQQLRREAASSRTRQSELEERLQEYEDKDKSELERLSTKTSEAERRATDAESRLLRYEIAAEHGLGMEAAAFLSGSTREEIELRAEELGKLLADKGRPPAGGFDGGARQPVPEHKTPEEAHNDLLLKSLGMGRRT
jgi:DNA repair exonuclease SbcCD ATPase subunit